jgi:crotonobetainyl-CoA:carnitine CoA-transferase CaiB-like acyl-CoA transferase
MTLPLEGVRVVEYAQYVAGPLCGVLLADLGADVVKVEPPTGDGYRHVLPAAPGVGRYFVPLNRGKRSIVVDLKSGEGVATSARLLDSADVVIHNFLPDRARRFGLEWEQLHAAQPALVVGRVTSFGTSGPLAGVPAYDLVAQARAGLLTAHASRGDTVPVRAGGIPMADLTAGFLLATGVLAALVRARQAGSGELVDVSLLAAALAVQLQDLVWLAGEADAQAETVSLADRAHLDARADEIASGVALNPYYRCFEASDGFVAVACLNLAQRRAFLALFGLEDATIDAPDLVPDDPATRAAKEDVTSAIAGAFAERSAEEWIVRLESAGVPCGRVQQRETVHADPQVVAEGLITEVEQDGLGAIRLLAPFLRISGATAESAPAPALGGDTEAVLAELR